MHAWLRLGAGVFVGLVLAMLAVEGVEELRVAQEPHVAADGAIVGPQARWGDGAASALQAAAALAGVAASALAGLRPSLRVGATGTLVGLAAAYVGWEGGWGWLVAAAAGAAVAGLHLLRPRGSGSRAPARA
jgi:hypothetical protein